MAQITTIILLKNTLKSSCTKKSEQWPFFSFRIYFWEWSDGISRRLTRLALVVWH